MAKTKNPPYNPSKTTREKAYKVKNDALKLMKQNKSPNVRLLCEKHGLNERTFYRVFEGGLGFKRHAEKNPSPMIVGESADLLIHEGVWNDGGEIDMEDKLSKFKPKSLSPSGAGTYRQCPFKWKLNYVDKLPSKAGSAALQGTFVHKVLEDLLAFDPKGRTKEKARSLCKRNWPEFKKDKDYISLSLDQVAEKKFKKELWAFVEGYFDEFNPTEVNVIERELRVQGSAGKVPFNGYVDLLEDIDGEIRVTDYKTGKAPRGKYVRNALSQIYLYAAALQSIGQKVDSVALVYIKNGTTKEGKVIERKLNDEDMNIAVERHEKTWDDIHDSLETKNFPPKTSPLCGWCEHTDLCEEGRNFLGEKKSNRLLG